MAAPAVEVPTIAVMPLQSKRVPADTVAILNEILVTSIANSVKLRVIGASDINAMLGLEQMKDALTCDNTACAADIGGALGVDYLIVGTAGVLGESLVLTLSLLDTRHNQALARARNNVPNKEDLFIEAIDKIVSKLLADAALPIMPTAPAASAAKPTPPPANAAKPTAKPVPTPKPEPAPKPTAQAAPMPMPPAKPEATKAKVDKPGKLTVTSPVEGAELLLDGAALGPLPLNDRPVDVGKHQLVAMAPQHIDWQSEVELEADESVKVEASLKPYRPYSVSALMAYRERTDPARPKLLGFGEFRYRHFSWFASRYRLGGGAGLKSDHHGEFAMSVGAELVWSAYLDEESLTTVSTWPVELFFGADFEVHMGNKWAFAALTAQPGIRLYWLYLQGVAGVAFSKSRVGFTGGITGGATLTF